MSETTDLQTERDQQGWRPGLNTPKPSSASGQSLIGPTVVIRGELVAEEDRPPILEQGRAALEAYVASAPTEDRERIRERQAFKRLQARLGGAPD